MPSYKAGQELDAFCTKCKMDLLHRVVAAVNGKPAKVECRTCFTTHVYRPPKGVRTPGAAAPAAAPASSGGSTATPRKPRAAAVDEGPMVPPDGVHVHIYKMTERFAPETWVQHKTFGMGRVLREVPPDKIEVRFDDGPKLLVHGKTP